MQNAEVIFSTLPGKGGDIGEIKLNRPASLNALNLFMCVAIKEQLQQWEKNPQIKGIIIKAEGEKAFCAGGDIRSVYQWHKQEGDVEQALNFFSQEYQLNFLIFHCSKPYIAFLDGLTLGGGAGISLHGSHPLASERFTFGMPETSIGFFPDVGMGYHLARLPQGWGNYLALSGRNITAQEAWQLGLVKAIIPHQHLAELQQALIDTEFDSADGHAVDKMVRSFHLSLQPEVNDKANKNVALIADCFTQESVEQIYRALHSNEDFWTRQLVKELQTKSPLSLKVTHEHLKHCQQQEFNAVMHENFCLVKHFLKGHDFFEGIRAAIIDKDRNPQWQPHSLEEITSSMVESYFTK